MLQGFILVTPIRFQKPYRSILYNGLLKRVGCSKIFVSGTFIAAIHRYCIDTQSIDQTAIAYLQNFLSLLHILTVQNVY